ncbi:sensor histidine kinase [Hydrogenophaga crassostreae]|nr:HAMP domain-containing sensor histidine kinase [Hydrogenophaga crassostreae]
MNVRSKLTLTIALTGLFTALGVVLALVFAYERFEHESSYYRADAFLKRVTAQHTDLLGMRERFGDEFDGFLANLVLYEADTQLYLLDPQGRVLSSTSQMPLAPDYRVNMNPVMRASSETPMPYVLGDNPESMDTRVVVAARALRPMSIAPSPAVGYLYLVTRPSTFAEGNPAALRSVLAQPFVVMILAVVALSTLLAAWLTATITRPLKRLTEAVNRIRDKGLQAPDPVQPQEAAVPWDLPDTRDADEFGQLARGIGAMLQTLRGQWTTMHQLDHFRREGVSNLSHDLQSPLTATTTCLETLDQRWAVDPSRQEDRALVAVALRNTRNASRLVHSLGDLARLDEPSFQLKKERLNLGELLDGVSMRFAERARQAHVALSVADEPAPVSASVDVQLIERAVANLVDNALKFAPPNSAVTLRVEQQTTSEGQGMALIAVRDLGPGIDPHDLPHLFDRFYQSRRRVAPATGEGGKGLGLAIVKRIAELHGGLLTVSSVPGSGTEVVLEIPAN